MKKRKRKRYGGPVPGKQAGGRADRVPRTAPENRATLVAQQQQLVSDRRPVQMFPTGTPELPVPPGMKRINVDGNVFHYNPRKIDPNMIAHLSRQGRENQFLGLGPVSKHEVAARAQRGDPALMVAERRPDGTEVRASAATASTMPHQHAAMMRGKDPENKLHVEHPLQTGIRRLVGHLRGR